MSPQAREERLLDLLRTRGADDYESMARALGVSIMTVRRVVDRLAAEGKVIKTLGGAQAAGLPPDFYESDLAARLKENRAEKQAIAHAAIALLKAQDTVFMDGSTTCLELAAAIRHSRLALHVVTNSLLIGREVGRDRRQEVTVIGGQYDPASLCCHGRFCEEQLRRMHFDKAVFSTKGFVPGEGTFESAVALFHIKRLAATRAQQVLLLVDHSKFGLRALCQALDMKDLDVVVTDDGVSRKFIRELERAGKRVEIAPLKPRMPPPKRG